MKNHIMLLTMILCVSLATSVVYAGTLLDEMQVQDTCGTTYADKLVSCTPFKCQKTAPMAMNIPSDRALQEMSPKQRRQLREQMDSLEKRLEKMSAEKRAAMKAGMTSILEIKGYDGQGRCQTSTLATSKYRQDCAWDKSMLQRVSEYSRLAADAKVIQISSTSRLVNGKMVTEQVDVIDGQSMSNPWKEALDKGWCEVFEKDPARGWKRVDGRVQTGRLQATADVSSPQTAKDIETSNTLFILDASGSMWGQIKGKPKISIAKEVMAKLVPELSANSRIGLIAYGHRRKGDCNDVETLVKLATNNKQAVLKAVKGLNAKGKTPLSLSVNQAFKMLQMAKYPSTIILVSDGIESCDGDPCATVKAAKKSGLNFVLHTVGFGVSKKESRQLQCMAKAGGGEYFQANNAEELLKSARQAVQPKALLKLTVKVNGKVTELNYRVEDVKTGKVIQQPVLPTSSGMAIQLSGGQYNVFVSPAGVSGASEQKLSLVIQAGEVIEKTLLFGKGVLRLTVTVNGKPAHAYIHIEDSVTHKGVYESSVFGQDTPLDINLAAGKVDVVVQVGRQEKDVQRIGGIEIVAGKTTEQVIVVAAKPVTFNTADVNGMEQDTDRPGGGDFRHIVPERDDPLLCQQACQDDAQCNAWTYVRPNTIQGPMPNCWLKTGKPAATHNTCCVSGLKKI